MHEDIWSIIFEPAHIAAEIFWNGLFFGVGYLASRIRSFKKIHKYIDDKHGVTHEKGEY